MQFELISKYPVERQRPTPLIPADKRWRRFAWIAIVGRSLRMPTLAGAIVLALTAAANAQPVKSRVSVLLDSSGTMLLTPENVQFPETCVANNWNGCTSSGNPSTVQETCNACMAWTVRQSPGCATNFDAGCRTTYGNCWRAFNGGTPPSCGQVLGVGGGVSTRGDGSDLTPGCDVNGGAQADDSRLNQAKTALTNVLANFGGIEFSLWRFSQVEGGQSCSTDPDCPETPGGLSVLTCEVVSGTNRCALDASALGSANGQCDPLTWNGSDGSFSCSLCSDSGTERLVCEAHALGAIRTGGVSPLGGVVDCALPTADHRFLLSHGAILNANQCDPDGAEQLVDFPLTGADDNRPAIVAWLDGERTDLETDVELGANGTSPIAASLRDLRSAILASAEADTHTPCRRHEVVLVTDSGEACESVAAAVAAAADLQNLSYTNGGGVEVSDYDVPVYVIGLGICPPADPNCQTRSDLDAIAVAGGTGAALLADDSSELLLALEQVAGTLVACAPPDLGKAFLPDAIVVGGLSTLTFTVSNENAAAAITGVAFVDPFPPGIEVAATPTVTTSGCGTPTFAPSPGETSLSFSDGDIAASGTCTATVKVTATTAGEKTNITGNVSATDAGVGNSGSSTLTVLSPDIFADGFESGNTSAWSVSQP